MNDLLEFMSVLLVPFIKFYQGALSKRKSHNCHVSLASACPHRSGDGYLSVHFPDEYLVNKHLSAAGIAEDNAQG